MQIPKEVVPMIVALVYLIPGMQYVCFWLSDLLGLWCPTLPALPKYFRAMMYNTGRCAFYDLLIVLFLRLSENDFIKPDRGVVCGFVAPVMKLLILTEVTFLLKNFFLLWLESFFKVYEPTVLDFKKMALPKEFASKETFVDRLNSLLQPLLVVSVISTFMMVTKVISTYAKFILLGEVAVVLFICRDVFRDFCDGIAFQMFFHPFDVGNCCQIDGKLLLVVDMRILDTVFMNQLGDIVYFPNKLLWNKGIEVL